MNYKEQAKNSFFQRDYKMALLNFSFALKDKPNDREAKIGAMLADMAFEKEDEAVALFEFYEVSKIDDVDNANSVVENIIHSNEVNSEILFSLFSDIEKNFIALEDGINYIDFKNFIEDRGDFKSALEDLMFSSKIIIHKKEDFIDFLEKLLENGYKDLALNYLESALSLYPGEKFFKSVLKQLEVK
jgi:tetratricopeptide (TPR) repeat protein